MAMEQKKKNFTNEERDTFLRLIKKEKVIYSSKTEAAGSSAKRLKDEAWVRIADEFNNSEGYTKRTVAQLKKLWDNLKTAHKSKISKQKKSAMLTGGGVIEDTYQDDPNIEVLMDTYVDIEHRDAMDSDTILLMTGIPEKSSTPMLLEMACSPTTAASRNTDSDLKSNSKNSIPIDVELSSPTSHTNEDQVETPKNSNRENNWKRTDRVVEVEESDEEFLDSAILTSSKKKKTASGHPGFQQVCDVQKKLLQEEHEKKMQHHDSLLEYKLKMYKEKTEAYQAKKEYYLLKKRDLSNSKYVD